MRPPPRLCAVFPETPARVPRQPECTIPTPRSPTSATGTQSATATERQRSVSALTSASASPAKPGCGPEIHGGPDPGEVLVDRPWVVADLLGDVQRVVRWFGGAAETREEEDPDPLGRRVRCEVDGAPSRG